MIINRLLGFKCHSNNLEPGKCSRILSDKRIEFISNKIALDYGDVLTWQAFDRETTEETESGWGANESAVLAYTDEHGSIEIYFTLWIDDDAGNILISFNCMATGSDFGMEDIADWEIKGGKSRCIGGDTKEDAAYGVLKYIEAYMAGGYDAVTEIEDDRPACPNFNGISCDSCPILQEN